MPVLLLYEITYLPWSSKLYVAQHIENGCGLLILLILEVLLMDTRVPVAWNRTLVMVKKALCSKVRVVVHRAPSSSSCAPLLEAAGQL